MCLNLDWQSSHFFHLIFLVWAMSSYRRLTRVKAGTKSCGPYTTKLCQACLLIYIIQVYSPCRGHLDNEAQGLSKIITPSFCSAEVLNLVNAPFWRSFFTWVLMKTDVQWYFLQHYSCCRADNLECKNDLLWKHWSKTVKLTLQEVLWVWWWENKP